MTSVKLIQNEADYDAALARVTELMDDLSGPDGQISDENHPSRIELDLSLYASRRMNVNAIPLSRQVKLPPSSPERPAAPHAIASSFIRRLTLMVARHIAAGRGGLPRPESSGGPGAEIDYPSSDGEPMAESERQLIPMAGTFFILRDWFRDRPDVYIGCDLLIYYREGDNGVRVAPDVFAVFGASGNHPRDSWKLWEEGKAPDFVLEIASPSTWREDIARKRDIYRDLKVSEYWRFDPTGELFTPPLAWEQLDDDGTYHPRPLSSSPDGTLWARSAVLGLDICARADLTLQLYDPVGGRWLIAPEQVGSTGPVSADARLQALEGENRRLREELRRRQSGSCPP